MDPQMVRVRCVDCYQFMACAALPEHERALACCKLDCGHNDFEGLHDMQLEIAYNINLARESYGDEDA